MYHILMEIGLTPTEAKVYMVLLELGESKASEILKRGKINSGRIYEVLDSLEIKGFVSKIVKKGVKFFIPSPPAMIKSYLDDKRKAISNQEAQIDKILPELMKTYSEIKSKTNVELFLGLKGMRASYDIFFQEGKKHKELLVLGVARQTKYPSWLFPLLTSYVYKERKRLNLRIRKLMDAGTEKESFWKQDNSKIKYVSLPTLTSIEILGECVIIQIFQDETISLLIKSKTAAEGFRTQFELLWERTK